MYRNVEVNLHAFLNFTTDTGEHTVPRLPRGKCHSSKRGCLCPRARFQAAEGRCRIRVRCRTPSARSGNISKMHNTHSGGSKLNPCTGPPVFLHVKVKFAQQQTMKAQKESSGTSLLFLQPRR